MISCAKLNCLASDRPRRGALSRDVLAEAQNLGENRSAVFASIHCWSLCKCLPRGFLGNAGLGSESGFASTSGGWMLDRRCLNISKALGDPISRAVS
jgi:hypothetical protein